MYSFSVPSLLQTQKIEMNIMCLMSAVMYSKCTENKNTLQKIYLNTNLQTIRYSIGNTVHLLYSFATNTYVKPKVQNPGT
jgi:hypothetical protein